MQMPMIPGRLRRRGAKPIKAAQPSPFDDYWYREVTAPVPSGVEVNPTTAMQVEAVQACVRVLSETLAQLPLIVYRRLPDGGKERAAEHPLYRILHDRPNAWQTSFEFRELLMMCLCLRGNGYAMIVEGSRGAVTQLVPLDPARVQVKQLPDYSCIYKYRMLGGQSLTMTADEMFHVRNFSLDGMVGMTPIEMARDGIGEAIAAGRTAATLFGQGFMHGGVLKHPHALSDKAYGRLKSDLQQENAGVSNAYKLMILEEGMDWAPRTMTAEDAQFLETRKLKRSDICGLFRVPPHMIGDLERATFSNIEHQDTAFMRHSMLPWLRRWEEAISRNLFFEPEKYFAEFLVEGLLRADVETRGTYFATAITNGWMTRNEVRRLENWNPLPGLDEPLVPMNMTTAGAQVAADGEVIEPLEAREARALRIMVEDAAERIAAAEIRELETHAKHADGDRERFNTWVRDFYDRHRGYVARALVPISL